jgi:hypothetical protein
VRLECKQVLSVGGVERPIRSVVLRVIRSLFAAPRIWLISGFLIFEYAYAFQTTPPGGPQGPFTSSGAPANTAGAQGPFTSSGAPPNTAGSQPALPSEVISRADPTLEDEDTKLAAIEQAARSEDLGALRKYLQDSNAAVQTAAFEALLARNEASAVQDLLAIIRDTGQLVRLQALQVLDASLQVDDQTVRAALRGLLADPDPVLREYASDALAVRDALPIPASGVGSQVPFTSSGAPANTSGAQGPFMSSGAPANTAGAQPSFPQTSVAEDPESTTDDSEAKLAGIDAAAKAGNVKALRRYLEDTDASVQGAAFEALLANDEQSAIQDLLAIVRDPRQLSRGQALQLLDGSPRVDDQTARTALRNALLDPDHLLQEYARAALAVWDTRGQRR